MSCVYFLNISLSRSLKNDDPWNKQNIEKTFIINVYKHFLQNEFNLIIVCAWNFCCRIKQKSVKTRICLLSEFIEFANQELQLLFLRLAEFAHLAQRSDAAKLLIYLFQILLRSAASNITRFHHCTGAAALAVDLSNTCSEIECCAFVVIWITSVALLEIWYCLLTLCIFL